MKKKCSYIQFYLSDYIDDILPDDKRTQFREHTRLCFLCRSELKSLKRMNDLLSFYVDSGPPKGYNEQFLNELQQLVDKKSYQIWWRIPAFCRGFFWHIEDFYERLMSSVLPLINRRFYTRWVMGFTFVALLFVLSLAFYPQLIYVSEDRIVQANVSSDFLEVSGTMSIVGNRQLTHNRHPIVLVSQWSQIDKKVSNILKQRKSIEMKMESLILDRREAKPLYDVEDQSNFLLFAQLTAPAKTDRKVDYAVPSSIAFSPFSEKVEWRRSSHTNRIFNNLSVARVYDPVRL